MRGCPCPLQTTMWPIFGLLCILNLASSSSFKRERPVHIEQDEFVLQEPALNLPLIVTVTENSTATLPCRQNVQNASIHMVWTKGVKATNPLTIGSFVFAPDPRLSVIGATQNLLITNVKRGDHGRYFCQTSANNGEVNPEVVLIVEVPAPPEISGNPPGTGISKLAVLEGNNLTLVCDATGKPRPTVKWVFGNNGLGFETQCQGAQQTGNNRDTLFFPRFTALCAGRYTCEASNGVLPNAIKSWDILVVPPVSPGPVINVTVTEAETVVLTCPIEQSRDKLKGTWRRRGRFSRKKSRRTRVMWTGPNNVTLSSQYVSKHKRFSLGTIGNWTLRIQQVQPRDEGLYSCQINDIHRLISLKVLGIQKPEVYSPNKRIHQPVGTDTFLECVVRAKPVAECWWEKGDQIIGFNATGHKYRSITFNTTTNLTGLLRIFNLEKEDYGTYTCVAVSGYGRAWDQIVLEEKRSDEWMAGWMTGWMVGSNYKKNDPMSGVSESIDKIMEKKGHSDGAKAGNRTRAVDII